MRSKRKPPPRGELLILKPDPDNSIERRELVGEPDLETLHKIVGGYIEAVPGFLTIEVDGVVRNCIAFANEEGKLDRPQPLPVNRRATVEWDRAMRRAGVRTGLLYAPGASFMPPDRLGLTDHLVGNIAVVIGDDLLAAMRSDTDDDDSES